MRAAGTLCMPAPRPAVFRHFIDVVAGHAGAIYGRRIYEVMRYWDVDRPEWDVAEREYLRVSTERQADRGVSLDAQRAKAKAYAELYDLELAEVIIDAG